MVSSRFGLDKLRRLQWYWRRPGQLPYQYGPHWLKITARFAAWKATRKEHHEA